MWLLYPTASNVSSCSRTNRQKYWLFKTILVSCMLCQPELHHKKKCCTVFIIRGLLKQWAEFSVSNLPSPPLQKCTDDFEGPSPNNVNLAAKVSICIMCTNPHCCQHGWSQGIVGLAAYTYLLRQNDQNSEADHYDTLNRGYVQYWLKNGLVR